MYCNKQNVNILTSLLLAHGLRQAVVCPGSRNAPIVHNLCQCEQVRCYPVTDERSAAFFALGLILATGQPAAICVTSGSALLNVAPAVAEAFYQRLPLVVISADRPEAWIGQLDGQTLPQQCALAHFVNLSVSLPSATDDEVSRWHCNRLVNEAMMALHFPASAPVHINIPITEPLFDFSVPSLPKERVVTQHFHHGHGCAEWVAEQWLSAKRPLVVIGQCRKDQLFQVDDDWRCAMHLLSTRGVLLSERLCGYPVPMTPVDEAMALVGNDELYTPDLVIYAGGHVVSKRLKAFLRKATSAKTIMLTPGGSLEDVTMHAHEVVELPDPADFVFALGKMWKNRTEDLSALYGTKEAQCGYHACWQQVFDKIATLKEEETPTFSQMEVVRYFEQQLEDIDEVVVHYANSSAVRLANIFADHPVYCNRGVNGIEGSLSTAAGHAAATSSMVICVIGDLSFFYDQNALWNHHLKGNFRIILLNNGSGGIFRQLEGLQTSEALDLYVSGSHQTTAQGICTQNDIGYLHAANREEMRMAMVTLLTAPTNRPMLLEVFTDADTDAAALKQYYNRIVHS